MGRKHLLLVLLLACAFVGQAQSFKPEIVAVAGDVYSNSDFGDLHWTLGEPMVETYDGGTAILTQGFHQVYLDLLISVRPELQEGIVVNIYPNPTSGAVWVDLTVLPPESLVEVYNQLGQMVLQQHLQTEKTLLDIEQLNSGIYLISIRNAQFVYRTLKVKKVSL